MATIRPWSGREASSPELATWSEKAAVMLPEHVETLIVGGGQAGLAMSSMLSQRDCPHLVLEKGSVRRTLAKRALGWPQVSVSELVGEAPRFPFPPRATRRICHDRRNRRLPRRLCSSRAAADPLRRRGHRIASRCGRQAVCRGDVGWFYHSQECRDCQRSLPAPHHPRYFA